ncbi:NAD(P)/FAD-dependent oxidoreductase [Desulfurispirillum indicum]|uniref:NAD(P)/FAD-dependent oxidoreductase n=1 Tax=Desulfurispirillum indicum TaxID=936456 RepID=UPI001CFB6515|nr:NAD(P)/FAD-dependent oxidoreductase [Desulfurispirillum indicum]UCZ55462.1 NAD(P)/FAD-dependent oxidoreductase [Desulfurispirillum indicum]
MSSRQAQLRLPYGENLQIHLQRHLGLSSHEEISDIRIIRRSIDARQKRQVIYELLQVEYALTGEKLPEYSLENTSTMGTLRRFPKVQNRQVTVVGSGPAGLFCAYALAVAGVRVRLIEQGRQVDERKRDVYEFWRNANLDPMSNVQFGEGGAGTFSDGKLTTRIKSPHRDFVLHLLVSLGASRAILWDAKPHVGTDQLQQVLRRFREQLEMHSVSLHFGEKVVDLRPHGSGVDALTTGQSYYGDALVLAVGNSARDTFERLSRKLQLQSKPLAVGVRIEHPRDLVDRSQYGHWHLNMPAAEYHFSAQCAERGVYTFCMCPGGLVVNASSEVDHIAVNGMSYQSRSAKYSNSALVVTVDQRDFGSTDPLAGLAYQRAIESACYRFSQSYRPPAMTATDFLWGTPQGQLPGSSSSPAPVEANLHHLLPQPVTVALGHGLREFERKMPGFIEHGLLIAPETRTSSPVRIPRERETLSSSVWPQIYPCGEGAGYAGGIVSAAVDGVNTALAILCRWN